MRSGGVVVGAPQVIATPAWASEVNSVSFKSSSRSGHPAAFGDEPIQTPPAMPQPNAVDLVRPAILLVGLLVVLALVVGR